MNNRWFAGFTDGESYDVYASDEIEYISKNDLLFNSTGIHGYFTSKSTGEEFISLSLVHSGVTKQAALDHITK